MLNVQLDVKRNPGIWYILSNDGGVTSSALKGSKRTNRENEVREDQTDESSKLRVLQSNKCTKARNVEPSQIGRQRRG